MMAIMFGDFIDVCDQTHPQEQGKDLTTAHLKMSVNTNAST